MRTWKACGCAEMLADRDEVLETCNEITANANKMTAKTLINNLAIRISPPRRVGSTENQLETPKFNRASAGYRERSKDEHKADACLGLQPQTREGFGATALQELLGIGALGAPRNASYIERLRFSTVSRGPGGRKI